MRALDYGNLGTYNSVTGITYLNSVPFNSSITTRRNNEGHLRFNIAKTVEQLASHLNVSGSISGSYAGNSGSAKSEFIKSRSVSAATTFVSVYASYRIETRETTDVMWNPSYNDAKEIFETSGDSYIASAWRGAEFCAVYSFSTETEEEQNALVAQLAGSGIVDGAKIDANLQTSLDQMQAKFSLNISFQFLTLGVMNWDGKGGLIEFAQQFGTYVDEHGVGDHLFQETMMPLYTLSGSPVGLREISDNIDNIVGGGIFDYRDSLLKRSIIADANLRQNQSLREIYVTYGSSDKYLAVIDENKRALEQVKASISQIYEAFKKDPVTPLDPNQFPSTEGTQLQITYQVSQPSGYGNPGGSPFDVTNVGGDYLTLIRAGCHVSKLHAWAGRDFNRLELTYSFLKKPDVVQSFGDKGGSELNPFNVAANDYLSAIEMRFPRGSQVLAKTVFHTSSGAQYAVAQQPDTQNYVSISPDTGGGWRFLGFSGRSGSKVDILYPVLFQLNQPTIA